MNAAGIIAEYNPFHKGHEYHIEQTKKATGADYVIAIMSGYFVQRGVPALVDKYERAASALIGGCDLVLELPAIYSSASAEFFASGAVLLLNALGVCRFLSFGSERGSLGEFTLLADLLANEPPEYKIRLKDALKKGYSYPKAREIALVSYCKTQNFCQFSNDFFDCLKEPNNILSLEYIKALKKYGCTMQPITILRKNASYHDKKVSPAGMISSAASIRTFLHQGKNPLLLRNAVPADMLMRLQKAGNRHAFLKADDLTPYLHQALLSGIPPEKALDLSPELTNRLKRLPFASYRFTELANHLKSRQVTLTRIQRGLLHLILGLTEENFFRQYRKNPAPYVKILGFKKRSAPLLKAIKENSTIPVITKPAHIGRFPSLADCPAFDTDKKASNLYRSLLFVKSGAVLPGIMEQNPVILP